MKPTKRKRICSALAVAMALGCLSASMNLAEARVVKRQVKARVPAQSAETDTAAAAGETAATKLEAEIKVDALEKPVQSTQAVPDADAASEAKSTKTSTLAPIDALQRKIIHDRARRIGALATVQAALNRGQYVTALSRAKALKNNSEFKDYYHFLSGQAHLGRMKTFAKSKQWANALLAGEQATFHFIQAQAVDQFSVLSKRSIALMGETEVAMGDLNLRARKPKKAREVYEQGFQRLSQINLLGLVPRQTVVSYAMLCEKKKNDLCSGWVGKLAPFVVKSDDSRVVERVAQAPTKFVEKRVTTTTYRVDLDLQAFQKGFDAYLAGDYDGAYVTWSQLIKDYPRTSIKLRTKFWMGRAAQRSNHDAHAETLYREVIAETPFAYYSLLASWFGGIDLSRMIDAEIPLASSEAKVLSPSDMVHVNRAETLLASGARELAQIELQNVKASANMPNEFLVYLATLNHMAGNHLASFQIFNELGTRGYKGLYSRFGQTLIFPTVNLPVEYRDVEKGAKEMGVDPLLVLSIIKQESAFNPEAVSGAAAYGLMQIIRPTAQDLDPEVQMVDLLTANKNVHLGTKYVSQLLSKYSGNVVPVLAAYNAGPRHSDRWLRAAAPSLAPEEFIEQVTFRETREYIQNVLRNYYWYSRRLRKETFPTLGALLQTISTIDQRGKVSRMGPPLHIEVEARRKALINSNRAPASVTPANTVPAARKQDGRSAR